MGLFAANLCYGLMFLRPYTQIMLIKKNLMENSPYNSLHNLNKMFGTKQGFTDSVGMSGNG